MNLALAKAFMLILVVGGGTRAAITQVPYATVKACEAAAPNIEKTLYNKSWLGVYTVCTETGLGGEQ